MQTGREKQSRGSTIESSLSANTGIEGQLPGDVLRWKMMVSWWLLSGDNAWKEMRWDWAEGEANSSCGCSWSLSQPHGVPLRGAPRRGKGLCLAFSSSPALGCPQVRQLCIAKEAVTYEQLLDTAADLFSDFAPHHTKFKTLRRNRLAYLVMCSQFDWSSQGPLIFCPSKTAQRGHTPPTKKAICTLLPKQGRVEDRLPWYSHCLL